MALTIDIVQAMGALGVEYKDSSDGAPGFVGGRCSHSNNVLAAGSVHDRQLFADQTDLPRQCRQRNRIGVRILDCLRETVTQRHQQIAMAIGLRSLRHSQPLLPPLTRLHSTQVRHTQSLNPNLRCHSSDPYETRSD